MEKEDRTKGRSSPEDGQGPAQWSNENKFFIVMETYNMDEAELLEYVSMTIIRTVLLNCVKAVQLVHILGSETSFLVMLREQKMQYQGLKRLNQ